MRTRRIVRSLLVSLVAVSLAGGPARAVDPEGNDAGTGADAGDAIQVATSIPQGSYAGSISPPGDRLDYYAIDARKGDALTATFSASGNLAQMFFLSPAAVALPLELQVAYGEQVRNNKPNLFLVPFDGIWILRAQPVIENRFERIDYSFSFSLDPPVSAAIVDDGSQWKVLEADLRGGANFQLRARVTRPSAFFDSPSLHSSSRPVFAYAVIEIWSEDEGARWLSAIVFDGRGIGEDVVVSQAGVDQDLPVRFEVDRGFGTLITSWSGPFEGKLRFTLIDSHDAPDNAVSFVADAPVPLRTASGDGVVRWSEGSTSADPQVRAPGVSLIGPQTFELDVAGRFAGYFRPGTGPGAPTYTVEDPAGAAHLMSTSCSCVMLNDPMQGTWSFGLGQSIGYGERARHSWLGGAFVPRLGVFPEPAA